MIKKIFTISILLVMFTNLTVSAAISVPIIIEKPVKKLPVDSLKLLTKEDIINMSPKQLEQATGHKLNFFQKIAFKLAKKKMKKSGDASISKTLYIVLSILGLGWLAMGINDDFKGSDWLVCLLLTFLFVLPGLIYALIKMKKYY